MTTSYRLYLPLALFLALGLLPGGTPPLSRADDAASSKGPSPFVATVDGAPIDIIAYDNAEVSYFAEAFTFDSPSHPKLVRLRVEYKLDEVVRAAKTDLARALALKAWVVGALKFGAPSPDIYRDWSAISILDRVRQGEVVFCGQCAPVFQQACIAMGLPARFIELGIPYNPACHFTTEVYLREHDKWAVIDATAAPGYNCYYTVDGMPQSALEMHQRVVGGGMEKVLRVAPDGTKPVDPPVKGAPTPDTPPWYFYYIRWLTRCDVVSRTPVYVDPENTFDRWLDTISWIDDRTVPWEASKYSFWWVRNVPLSAWRTSDPAVVDWQPTSRTMMSIRTKGGSDIYIDLSTGDIDFDHFQVSVNGGDWQRLPRANTYMGSRNSQGHMGPVWGPRRFAMHRRNLPGATVRVQVVRRDGSLGPVSYVKFANSR